MSYYYVIVSSVHTCRRWSQLQRKVCIFWKIKSDLGRSWWTVCQSEWYCSPRASMNPIKLEMGLKKRFHTRRYKDMIWKTDNSNPEKFAYIIKMLIWWIKLNEMVNAISSILPRHLIIQSLKLWTEKNIKNVGIGTDSFRMKSDSN